MNLDYSRTRIVPYDIQRDGIEALVKLNDPPKGRIYPGCFALFDEMGVGKTKQAIDASQFLQQFEEIKRVIVVAPAAVRSVWFDEELGEITKHGWLDIAHRVIQFHSKKGEWTYGKGKPLTWIITNYEFIRAKERLEQLMLSADSRTMLVIDESSAVKTHSAAQTKAVLKLRQKCGRVVLLNGTPIANNPGDMFSQGQIMDPRILNKKTYFHFRSYYAIMGGWQGKQITGWHDDRLREMQQRFKPYVLRRLTEDSMELPKKNPPKAIQVPLSAATWRIYKEMRDEMVSWLDTNYMATATQAGTKALRLAQITSGFVGGVEDLPEGLSIDATEDMFQHSGDLFENGVREFGREKIHATLAWIRQRLIQDDSEKILIWSRFRHEVFNLYNALLGVMPGIHEDNLGLIIGSQKKEDRRKALRLLDPRTAPAGPAIVIGTPATGSMGLNCTASHTMLYISNDYNLKTRIQSMARIHRGGQTRDCDYFDVVAMGPNGQQTIDTLILRALNGKENLATWTAAAWRKALVEAA